MIATSATEWSSLNAFWTPVKRAETLFWIMSENKGFSGNEDFLLLTGKRSEGNVRAYIHVLISTKISSGGFACRSVRLLPLDISVHMPAFDVPAHSLFIMCTGGCSDWNKYEYICAKCILIIIGENNDAQCSCISVYHSCSTLLSN